jgi:hypothetical protein
MNSISGKFAAAVELLREAFDEQRALGAAEERARLTTQLEANLHKLLETATPKSIEPKAVPTEQPDIQPVVTAVADPALPAIKDEELTDAANLEPPSYREWQLLRVLPLLIKNHNGRPSFFCMSSTANVPQGSVTAILDGLQRKGYIVREDGVIEISFHGTVKPYLKPQEPLKSNQSMVRLVEEEQPEAQQHEWDGTIRPPTREQLMAGR